MIAAKSGLAPAQMHGKGEESYLAMAVRVGDEADPKGFLLVKGETGCVGVGIQGALPDPGAFALDQYNGRFKSNISK